MSRKYIWLKRNLDKYKYNTDEAKKLYEQFKSIVVPEGMQPGEETVSKLKECYDRFVSLFNNNPFSYKNGLEECGIETNEFDYYFVKSGDSFVPIGFYKIDHPVESVVLLNEKVKKEMSSAIMLKEDIVKEFEANAQEIDEQKSKFSNEKTSSFVRAFISAVTSLCIIGHFMAFLSLTNIVKIITSMSNGQKFVEAVTNGMSNMYVLAESGVAGWIILFIVHVIALALVILNLKSIKNEFELAYQKRITNRLAATTKESINKIEHQFTETMENDVRELSDVARQGGSYTTEKGNIAQIISRVQKRIEFAGEYLEKSVEELRGIKNTKVIYYLILFALVGCFSYNIMSDSGIRNAVDNQVFTWQVNWDNMALRGKKNVQLVFSGEACPIYASTSVESKVKHTFPVGTEVELIGRKDVDGVEWSKVKKVTESKIVQGWIPTTCTIPYNYVDYNEYDRISVINAEASSFLQKKQSYEAAFACDGNRDTVWQDGVDGVGVGEHLTFHFEEKKDVSIIQIFPGDSRSEEKFRKNCRVKKAKLKFDSGSVTYEFDDNFNEEFQTIRLNKSVKTDDFVLEIIEVYAGETEDVCIGEICVYEDKKIDQEE